MKSSGDVHEISVSFSGNEVVTQLTGRTVVSVDILAGTDNILGLCVSEFAPVALLPQSLSGLTRLSLPLSLSYPRCPSKVERKIFYPYLQPRSLPLLPAVIASFRFTSSVFPQKGTGEDFLFHQPSTPSIGRYLRLFHSPDNRIRFLFCFCFHRDFVSDDHRFAFWPFI